MSSKGRRSTVFMAVLMALLAGWVVTARLGRPLAAQATTHYEDLQLFTDVLSIVRKSYVEEVPVKELVDGAINGMLAALDPHSSFLPPDMYKEMKIDTSGEFGGLGIEISVREGVLTIVSPIEDTPAFRAGLQAGDQILKIEGKFTKDMGVMDAVKLMRGPRGSRIAITVMRHSFEKPREFVLIRELIKVRSIKSRTLAEGFGYVRVAQFQERTAEDLRRALHGLREENGGELRGLVLDLRNNPGGLLDQAVEVADLFIPEGLIVYTEGREEGTQMRFSASAKGTEPSYPIVTLINGGSASASEIVAGALQDHNRAVIMGTQSFGKGSVQTIIPLSDASGLRLTTARYYTPNGTSIQARGITPDITVKPMEVREPEEGERFREADLRNHFENPVEAPEEGVGPETSSRLQLEEGDETDYQLMRALDLLKGLSILRQGERQAA